MKKVARTSIMIDRAHKLFVVACVGLTLYGLIGLGQRWYRYFTVLRPEAKSRELMQQESLLQEGSSEILKDSAENLRS